MQKQGAPFLLLGLADCPGAFAQSLEGTKETFVGLVPPAHITRAPPAGGAQSIKSPVISDPGIGIGLHVVIGELGKRRPRLEVTGVAARRHPYRAKSSWPQ